MSPTTHEILILGGHYGALNTAHYLLRHIIPPLTTLTPSTTYHITIVAPHTEFFWNVAAPRYVANDQILKPSQLFLPIADAFKGYPADAYAFVQGKAVSLDNEARSVDVELSGSGERRTLSYETLVIATGTTSNSPLWQVNDGEERTKAEFAAFHARLAKAKTVLVGGGGAVGVETAGELGTYAPHAKTVLLSGSTRLLPRLLSSNSAAAETRLARLGVETQHNLRVVSTSKNADGTETVNLSDGSSRSVDVYIDATGGRPNSSFLPATWLNNSGHVVTDDKTLRVTAPGASGVYAVGDVASYSDGSLITVNNSIAPVATSIGLDIAEKAGVKLPAVVQKEYKPMQGTQLVPTGPKGGVGQLFGWKVPSTVVWLIKSRTYFVEKAEGALRGADYVKA